MGPFVLCTIACEIYENLFSFCLQIVRGFDIFLGKVFIFFAIDDRIGSRVTAPH